MNQKITTIFGTMLVSFGLPSIAFAAPGDFSFSQFSPFGAGPAGTQCPFCDSTVSFTAYETINDWTEELGFSPTTLLGSTSGTEDYLLLYQVVNTDTIPPQEDTLQRFLVSINEGNNSYFGNNLYKSAGYIENVVFDEASSAITPLDTPADGQVGSILTFNGFKTLDSAVEPSSVTYGEIADNAVEVLNGPTPTNGVTFLFDETNPIPITDTDPMAPGGRGTSSLLFLTVDKDFVLDNLSSAQTIDIGLTWGRTQRFPIANGTSGDVVGVVVEQVPEPSAVLGILAISGLSLNLKRKKQL